MPGLGHPTAKRPTTEPMIGGDLPGVVERGSGVAECGMHPDLVDGHLGKAELSVLSVGAPGPSGSCLGFADQLQRLVSAAPLCGRVGAGAEQRTIAGQQSGAGFRESAPRSRAVLINSRVAMS